MSGQDIAGLMRVWTTRMGYPYLTVRTQIHVHIRLLFSFRLCMDVVREEMYVQFLISNNTARTKLTITWALLMFHVYKKLSVIMNFYTLIYAILCYLLLSFSILWYTSILSIFVIVCLLFFSYDLCMFDFCRIKPPILFFCTYSSMIFWKEWWVIEKV